MCTRFWYIPVKYISIPVKDGWLITRNWREELTDKIFTSIEPEIGIRRRATNGDYDK
jgi:hypothetical protein